MIDALHLLRPWWLLAVPLTLGLWWIVRRAATRQGTRTPLPDHLEAALTIGRSSTTRLRPVDGVALALCLAAAAAAGPSWRQEPSPWSEETAPAVVAIEVSDSMRSNDVQPTRLDRARFKVLDLLEARRGGRTALIAYAGSAHVVSPPSRDIEVLRGFLASLDPRIMPVAGARTASVLPVAAALLDEDLTRGTLLFVCDGIEAEDVAALAAFANGPSAPAVVVLIVGTDAGGIALLPDGSVVRDAAGRALDTSIDEGPLERLERDSAIIVVRATVGDDDLGRIARAMTSHYANADDPDARWRDEGWRLLWPAALLLLFSFRRGWVMPT